ncbi:hypothetical protein LTSEINV_1407 [Salmonella enterica subsp. enterica serovar Inverness str. R8-3668]|uniref:Uncharacterized protein n=1 Tax=Salmonella enterica subsp. enterica serovar Inverness str. R8-3668 TaxID=913075 RepID=G5NAD0_SALET|nr:hypothetical protein LTSEINV_1407 [Salmonella enterica subsp. enterica serovar Inverness str. R8-3668]
MRGSLNTSLMGANNDYRQQIRICQEKGYFPGNGYETM